MQGRGTGAPRVCHGGSLPTNAALYAEAFYQGRPSVNEGFGFIEVCEGGQPLYRRGLSLVDRGTLLIGAVVHRSPVWMGDCHVWALLLLETPSKARPSFMGAHDGARPTPKQKGLGTHGGSLPTWRLGICTRH